MTTTIRPGTMDDYDAMIALIEQIDTQHRKARPDIFQYAEPARERGFFIAWLAAPNKKLLVAEQDGELYGMVMFFVSDTPDIPILKPRTYLFIDLIVVDKDHRGQGVGRALMEAVHEWGEVRNIYEVELGVWLFNEEAMAFYRSLGYEIHYHRMSRGNK